MTTGQNSLESSADERDLTSSDPDFARHMEAQNDTLPPTFEEWLTTYYTECDKGHHGRIYMRLFRKREEELWDDSTLRHDDFEQAGLRLSGDDVLMLKASGQATTRAEWNQVVQAMYEFDWQRSLANWARYEPAPLAEKEGIRNELEERWEVLCGDQC